MKLFLSFLRCYLGWIGFSLCMAMAVLSPLKGGVGPGTGVCIAQEGKQGEKVFIINVAIRDLAEFEKLVILAERLKPYGKVQINISTLADKGFYEVPKTRSPWYDYASNNSTPYKFFPDPKIAPYIPAAFVAKNRELILAKAKVLRAHGMEAAFFGSEPNLLPEAFFNAHPGLLGPRVDHPRRSNHKAFAPCISVKETQEMYAGMMAEMLKNIPEIKTFYFKTNDAGTGICWAHWLYTGSNGPSHCKDQTMGERVLLLMNAFKAGAEKAGTSLDIYLSEPQGSSNFSDEERNDIQSHLPANCFFKNTEEHEMISTGGGIVTSYPVTGIIDPFGFINSLRGVKNERSQTLFINFRSWYSKGDENLNAIDLSFAMLENFLLQTASGHEVDTDQLVHQLSEEWAGKKDGEKLFQAFNLLHDTFRFKEANLGSVYPINWNVAARMINRPLVAVPQRLTKAEESYFIPFVFNVSEEAARMDYLDIQGARRTTLPDSIKHYVTRIDEICRQLETIDKTAPQYPVIQQMALALRINASLMRSCGNFAVAQAIRDKNQDKLNGPAHRPDKEPTWDGDPDLLAFNEVMRDELDNAQELADLLSNGGIHLLCLAKDPMHEDSFLLGPELLAQVKKKRRVMLDHWRDIEDYMATPFR